MKVRSHTAVILPRVGYKGIYFLILPDNASGRSKRFTVYRIPSSPSRRTKIIGRELPLGRARRVVAREQKKLPTEKG